MKIRTLLTLSTVVAVALTVAVGLGIWRSARIEFAAAAEEARTQTTAREIAGLLVLTQEYAQRFDTPTAAQWRQRHATLLGALVASSDATAATVAELRALAEQLPRQFERLAALGGEPPQPG